MVASAVAASASDELPGPRSGAASAVVGNKVNRCNLCINSGRSFSRWEEHRQIFTEENTSLYLRFLAVLSQRQKLWGSLIAHICEDHTQMRKLNFEPGSLWCVGVGSRLGSKQKSHASKQNPRCFFLATIVYTCYVSILRCQQRRQRQQSRWQ